MSTRVSVSISLSATTKLRFIKGQAFPPLLHMQAWVSSLRLILSVNALQRDTHYVPEKVWWQGRFSNNTRAQYRAEPKLEALTSSPGGAGQTINGPQLFQTQSILRMAQSQHVCLLQLLIL